MPRKNRHTAMPTNTASDEPNGSAAQVATRCNLQYNMQQAAGNMNVASPEPAQAAELHRHATNATNLRATQHVATQRNMLQRDATDATQHAADHSLGGADDDDDERMR